MASPVWLDGPLEGQDHSVSEDAIEQGIYRAGPDLATEVYTFTRVQVFGRVVVVASVAGGIPQMSQLFDALTSVAAQAAAE
jgi:hypothetical protein